MSSFSFIENFAFINSVKLKGETTETDKGKILKNNCSIIKEKRVANLWKTISINRYYNIISIKNRLTKLLNIMPASDFD